MMLYKFELLIKMEEKSTIEVELFNEPHLLNRQDFLNFNQLITKQHFAEFKIPFTSLDDSKVHVLNIFVYYIITIQKNFKPFHDDCYGDKYKSLCTKEISDYYIKNKFVIEEYEFAFLSSKALEIKLQESAHIIYYLVYGRFASHPYINTLCGRKDDDFKKNVFKNGKQVIQNLKLLKKRTLNNQKSQTDMELENFKKDLKHALNSQQTQIIWKKDPLNTPKQTKTSQYEATQSHHATERKSLTRGSDFNTFIPQRITQGENSSIFETLPFQRKSYQTCTDWNRKGLMRKQKFNQFFDINDYKIKTKLKKSPSSYFEDKKQNNSKNAFFSSNSDQMGKINYQNFKNISNNLKMKNTTLDKIRAECSMRNQKPNQDKQNIDNQVENLIKLGQPTKGNQAEAKVLKLQHDLQEANLETLNLRRNFSSIDGIFLKELNLGKNFSYAPQRNLSFAIAEEQNEKVADFTINLLRNDESGKEKENDQGKKLDYFSKSSAGFKKMNCKYKLQRYKSDYRKFLKTQLLDRIKQAS